jgi:hypothetical protein
LADGFFVEWSGDPEPLAGAIQVKYFEKPYYLEFVWGN